MSRSFIAYTLNNNIVEIIKKKILLSKTRFLALTATANAQDVSVSTSIDYVSDYVFRGVSLADSAIQSGVEASLGAFTAGAWFSTGVGDTS